MNKLAKVLYAYNPKNDDELELRVDDKIEVIGFEEEGWWKGRLKGRIGVFPSNFVQIIETGSPTTQSIVSSTTPAATITSPVNKLSLLGTKTSKTSLSSNSLNSNNNNNNNNMMNNTQHQENSGLSCSEDSTIVSSERRPKPIRGVGFGDIFASGGKSKPLTAEPTCNLATDRLSTNITNTLPKQIPKKPPPPTPTDSSNGNSNDQAPALPPKPANQFSPHLQLSRPLPSTQQQVREQAKVVYAYEPSNDDELAMKVGDIIDIIDKNIEDAGWWKGELRGRIGVFPDNFVEIIENSETSNSDWQHRTPYYQSTISQPSIPNYNQNAEGKSKSVFAATPKGFSRELESNLEKHNSPASFLSLKRNKLQQQSSMSIATSESTMVNENEKVREDVVGPLETGTIKLNHITANRAKGPSRRPPSNVLNKRNQLDQGKRESNGRDDPSLGSLPINSISQSTTHDTLSSLPTAQHTTVPSTFSAKPDDVLPSAPIKPSLSLDNVLDSNQTLTPKTSQRTVQPTSVPDKNKQPPWMVELKQKADKKRDSPAVSATSPQEDEVPASKLLDTPTLPTSAVPTITENLITERKSAMQSSRPFNPTTASSVGAVKSLSSRYSGDFNTNLQNESQRISLLGNSSSNLANSNNEPMSINRISSVLNKNSPPSKTEFTPSYGMNATPISTNENGNTNANVPSSNVIKLSSIQSNSGVNLQPSLDNNLNHTVNTTSNSPISQRSLVASKIDKSLSDKPTADRVPISSSAPNDNLLNQISKDVHSEISELREEVKRIQADLSGMSELKSVLEVMKTELKACQSAIENQKRYIKELVNNLADERKRIAAMQTEIDRNLK